jgi:mannonate dehydratase
MLEAMRAYREIGFTGPIRPDHVPALEGEVFETNISVPAIPIDQIDAETFNGPDTPVPPGYTMLGRLYAVGYMRGLIEAVTHRSA